MSLSDALDAAKTKALAAIKADEEIIYTSDGEVLSASLMMASAWGEDDWKAWLELKGTNPEEVTFTFGVTSNPNGGYWNKLLNVKYTNKILGDEVPAWPVIQPSRKQYKITPVVRSRKNSKFKTAVVGADTQIGFDMDPQGNLTPYHDDAAMDIFSQIVQMEDPDVTALAGDIIDLTEQGRWVQEARFAHTTQPSLDRTREFAADLRARTSGKIIFIEGNHDKRFQGFMEANAKSAMGLKKAGYPDSWPVMSVPNLVGLDDFDIEYIDAYPAGAYWLTNDLRIIHGTKSVSKGSTASQYANETPHLSTIFGHSHRLEVQSKTIFDRAGKIRTMNVNPGCLCRVDGMVPGVHGARHLDGSKATYWENWQQGVTVVRFKESGEFFVELIQIDDGVAFHLGQELRAS